MTNNKNDKPLEQILSEATLDLAQEAQAPVPEQHNKAVQEATELQHAQKVLESHDLAIEAELVRQQGLTPEQAQKKKKEKDEQERQQGLQRTLDMSR